ncbi:MAG TPA: FGGY family carbohydrate kinase [Puia sp.]|nr:FGGY family carbohydrate kinase [Puia sp.]
MEAYLIIDIGTGNARVAVAAPDGEILSIERENVGYEKDDAYPDSIYFNPDELWGQIKRLMEVALQRLPGVKVTAITATSQREGIVLLGKKGESLIGLPNIDHRGREWEDLIADKSHVYTLTGRRPTSLFSALKLVGIRNRRPEIWDRFSTFLSISDWVQYKLSGVVRYEHSQASETLLYDVAGKSWSKELCGLFELDPSVCPELQCSGTVLGGVLPEYTTRLPFSSAAVVIIGGADTQLAIKSTRPSVDDRVIVSGTTTPIIQIVDTYVIDDRERTWTSRHTEGGKFILEANAGVTGLNYQRLKEIFYPNENYSVIEKELAEVNDFSCVAALGSLLADEKMPLTRGGFVFNVPVTHQLHRAHFVWSTLWDITCSIRENYRTLCSVSSFEGDVVWACGGGMQSPLLRQLIANLLNKKVQIRSNYRQSSVAGGVEICNTVLNKGGYETSPPEIIYPEDPKHFAALYEEWKTARAVFRRV